MGPKEGGEAQEAGQYDCETLPQIYMKLVAVKGEGGQLLSYWSISREIEEFLKERNRTDYSFSFTREGRDNDLKWALLSMEAFGMIKIEEKALGGIDFSFRVTEIGKQYADLFKRREDLEPIFEAGS